MKVIYKDSRSQQESAQSQLRTMDCGYILFAFVACAFCLIDNCQSHGVPQGLHLSKSCQPRCESGLTCVVYRSADGPGEPACVWLDPHQMVLDGTFIMRVQRPPTTRLYTYINNDQPGPRNNIHQFPTDNMMPHQRHIAENGIIHNLFPTNSNRQNNKAGNVKDHIETVNNGPEADLMNRFNMLSQNLKLSLLNDIKTMEKPKHSTNENRTNPMMQGQTSSQNSHARPSLSERILDLRLSRDENGNPVFQYRNIDHIQRRPQPNRSTHNRGNEVPSTTTPRDNLIQNTDQSLGKEFIGETPACVSCDPAHPCPSGTYCFFSPTCAKQICQHL